jgi:FkbM family methyltransferase
LGFIDTFNEGELFDLPITQVDEFDDNGEKVIICADQHHWSAMQDKLLEKKITGNYINLFWDFDIYGIKEENKYKKFERYISEVRKMFTDDDNITTWDTITRSMMNQCIELSFDYWIKRNKVCDYSKYISIKSGDVIINGGAAFGNETDYFVSKVGCQGKVFNFDPNISDSEESKNGVLINHSSVLWKKSSEVSFKMDGSRSMIVEDDKDNQSVSSVSIDDFIKFQQLNRLDFIKLDVEGAEPEALFGGVESIRKFRPQIAVSIYHKLEQFFEIPLYLNEQLSDYRFHIEFYNPYCIDTILYAIPEKIESND